MTIKVLHDDPHSAEAAIQAALREVRKIDALMSLYQERSQVFQLNRDGVVDAPDRHLLYVLAFAQQLSMLTAGAFDITVQPLWRAFSVASASDALPAPGDCRCQIAGRLAATRGAPAASPIANGWHGDHS